jgi:K+/H+ antiporter YhaU regulatory subunit KhtT
VNDEGGYWETRLEEPLKKRLGLYDGLVAAVAGMLKDAPAVSEGNLSLESPIFDYANFERLEHEGRQSFGRPLGELQKRCRKGRF